MKRLLVLLLLSISVNAELSIQCIDSGYIDLDNNQLHYGSATYERYDGQCRPLTELSEKTWSYSIYQNHFNYEICKKDKCIFLPIDKHLSYDFGFKKITVKGVFNNISNISKSLDKNNCREIILGNSLNWNRKNHKWESDYFLWDEEINIIPIQKQKIEKGFKQENISKKHGAFLIKNNNLVYKICKEDIDKDINGYEFIFNSYIVKGVGGDSKWSDGLFYNTTEKLTTNQLQLNWSNWSNGLVGYWNFDDGSLIDQTEVNNGSCSGENCPNVTIGKYGGAFSFDGVNDYVDCGTGTGLDITNSVSFGGWIYSNGVQSDSYAHVMGKANTYSMTFNGAGTILRATIRDGGTNYHTEYTVTHNLWHYIMGVFDGADMKIYVDGILIDTTPHIGDIDTEPTYKMYIGMYGSSVPGGINLFNGTIDEVRIYNRALSATEINLSMKNSKYYNGQYITKNIIAENNTIIPQISVNFIKNYGKISSWYMWGGDWVLINDNMENNKTYNILPHNDVKIKLKIITGNPSLTPEINEIVLNYDTTTTITTLITHEWINKKPIQDDIDINVIIIIGGILLAFIFFWMVIK